MMIAALHYTLFFSCEEIFYSGVFTVVASKYVYKKLSKRYLLVLKRG